MKKSFTHRSIEFKHWIIIIVLAFLFLFAWMMVRHEQAVSFGDARNYVDIALDLRKRGLSTDFGNVRTYGYPIALYALSFVSGSSPHQLRIVAGITQGLMYLGVVFWLTYELKRFSTPIALSAALALLLNVFNINLVTDTMTEAPSLIIVITIIAICLKAERALNLKYLLIYYSAATFISYYGLMVRPANITVVVSWTAAAGTLLWISQQGIKSIVVFSIIYIVIALTVLLPQVFYNFCHYGSLSAFPTSQLGASQAKWGVEMMKYATSISEGGVGSVIYKNPTYHGETLSNGAFDWYLTHPLQGLLTLALHTFNGFNIDYIDTYIDNITPDYDILLTFLVWFFILIGIWNLVCNAHMIVKTPASEVAHSSGASTLIFIGLLCTGTIALNSIIAVENRFDIVPISVFITSAVSFFFSVSISSRLRVFSVITCATIGSSVALAGSEWAQTYSKVITQAKQLRRTPSVGFIKCGDGWKAANDSAGKGFSPPESDTIGPFRWTVVQNASIQIIPCPISTQIELQIAFALTENNLTHVGVALGGHILKMETTHTSSGFLLKGHSDSDGFPNGEPVRLDIIVPSVDAVLGDPRTFGVAVRSIDVNPGRAAPQIQRDH